MNKTIEAKNLLLQKKYYDYKKYIAIIKIIIGILS